MATVTTLQLNQQLNLSHLTSPSIPLEAAPSTSPVSTDLLQTATQWAQKLQPNLAILSQAKQANTSNPFSGLESLQTRLDEDLLTAPRRKSADPTKATLASLIARLLYPEFPPDSLKPLIRYEDEIVQLRALILAQRDAEKAARTAENESKNWNKRILKQGPWDAAHDPVSLQGAPSLPMPVKIADKDELAPFFAHLQDGGDSTLAAGAPAEAGEEPYYGTKMLEFRKGVLYEDGRMDLCKMVVGPPHIGDLMKSLETNPFTRHFLLGNNVVGPTGARAIARFVERHPQRMETWYLAGNCIDAASFETLVESWLLSPVVTNVWVKRNPLGAGSAEQVYRLIVGLPELRTLDLDQTELGDEGVARLFSLLADHGAGAPLAIRNLYLNANGIGLEASRQIAKYLASESCTLTSLYMSNNPLGNQGAIALAEGLKANTSLERLSLQSTGITDAGTIAIIQSLTSHKSLTMLDLGQSYSTEDLGMRYNYFTDAAVDAVKNLIIGSSKLRYLNLGPTAMTQTGLNDVLEVVGRSSLFYYLGKSILPPVRDQDSKKRDQETARRMEEARLRMKGNVKAAYGGLSYEEFLAEEKRWLVSPQDVRKIDSVYRNRDAGLARRGLKVLDKWWEEGDETLEMVQSVELQ